MDTAVLAAQLVLAAVLVTAAVGKLLDLDGSRRAVAGFGVPERVASVFGTLLPFAELAIAVALVLQPSAQWGGGAALVLMLAFSGAIGYALARGEQPDCNCFGALHSSSTGWRALARDAVLAAIAAFVLVRGPGPSVSDWVADRTAAELVAVLAGVAALLLLAFSVQTWWENRRLRRHLADAHRRVAAIPPGLPVGALAPRFALADGTGMDLESLLARGLPVALVFMRPGCGPSEAMLPELERWGESLAERLTVAIVGSGSIARFQAGPIGWLEDAMAADPVLSRQLDELFEVFAAYRVRATPSAVLVSREGTIASVTVDGKLGIEALLRRGSAPAVPASAAVAV